MTTNNTHSEHSDVEASVVEHEPAVEQVPTPASEATEPAQEAVETPPMDEQQQNEPVGEAEQVQEMSSQAEEIPAADIQNEIGASITDAIEAAFASAKAAVTVPMGEPGSEPAEEGSTPSSDEEVALTIAFVEEEEVRPFTDFIEEFRQAEARFSSSLQAYQEETPATAEDEVAEETAFPQEELPTLTPTPEAEVAGESSEQNPATATPSERPVSPLLRPATRLRLPRHGGRHREEVATEKATTAEEAEAAEAAEAKTEATVPEPARPARRYRFDRPAAATTNGVTTSSPAANVAPASQAQPRTENGQTTTGQAVEKEAQAQPQAKQTASSPSASEQSMSKEAAAEATPASSAPSPAPEHDRRKRHSQERQRSKEQAASTTAPAAAEATPAVQEPATPAVEEVSPEDLPPLEYAELQKASSRRRRRRHTSSAATTATSLNGKATPPETSAVAPIAGPSVTPSVATPRTPAPSKVTPGQYAITSGFTVKQMNQGNETTTTSPFMGPEPSPARGSLAAQNVRSIRSDVQRTPAYPVRTTEATSASVHQLANVVAQAIQTQTDRMISELRRANQSPTNVSVSMPPFPSTERVGVFVDVANLLYSARNLRLTVDFGKLLDFLRGNRRLVRAHAYCPTSPQPGDEQMFLHAVKGLGYRITTKNYKTFSSGAKKADLDLDLCMDVVRLVDGRAVDCIVLVSGDSDFMPMLDYCSDHGVRVEVAAFDESMSATLRQSCDLFINLGMLEEIRA